ncbi:MAG: hypothetical protein GX799_11515, partial [Crenarchaeota archaeon]|nr:hypothetical protein [Thermoproteota archaeon]
MSKPSSIAFILIIMTTAYMISAQTGSAISEEDSWASKASMPTANAA